jgi:prepilin-type N-terminal cleavage/methylation domain-containing protein
MRVQKQPLRGMTLLEIMVVTAAVAGMAAMAGTSVADQVRRVRAVEAAKNTLHPHTVTRDRAVGARTCTETLIVPRIGDLFTSPVGFPAASQREYPRVAVIEWTACGEAAVIARVDFIDLDGDVTIAPYNTVDGRVVFSPDGGLTNVRPGNLGGTIILPEDPCRPSGGGGGGAVASEGEGEGEGGGRGGGAGGVCLPPPPPPPPPSDVEFTATTFFGEAVDYVIYARVGATEQLP